MPVYRTTFEIDASAARVWAVLTDLPRYPEWNPQITNAEGRIEPGARLQLRLSLPGRPALGVWATVEEAQPDARLSWRGHVAAAWVFEGYREFGLEPLADDRVRLTHVEDIHGLLAPLFALAMGGPAARSHAALNDALKRRAEHPA